MPLSKDGELVTRGTYYGAGGSYYMSHDSQLSSVSNSSSGSLRHTPDVDRGNLKASIFLICHRPLQRSTFLSLILQFHSYHRSIKKSENTKK